MTREDRHDSILTELDSKIDELYEDAVKKLREHDVPNDIFADYGECSVKMWCLGNGIYAGNDFTSGKLVTAKMSDMHDGTGEDDCGRSFKMKVNCEY